MKKTNSSVECKNFQGTFKVFYSFTSNKFETNVSCDDLPFDIFVPALGDPSTNMGYGTRGQVELYVRVKNISQYSYITGNVMDFYTRVESKIRTMHCDIRLLKSSLYFQTIAEEVHVVSCTETQVLIKSM